MCKSAVVARSLAMDCGKDWKFSGAGLPSAAPSVFLIDSDSKNSALGIFAVVVLSNCKRANRSIQKDLHLANKNRGAR